MIQRLFCPPSRIRHQERRCVIVERFVRRYRCSRTCIISGGLWVVKISGGDGLPPRSLEGGGGVGEGEGEGVRKRERERECVCVCVCKIYILKGCSAFFPCLPSPGLVLALSIVFDSRADRAQSGCLVPGGWLSLVRRLFCPPWAPWYMSVYFV